MHGLDILARSLSTPGAPDRFGYRWQYHSRSNRHSKVAAWTVAYDLLLTSPTLRRQAAEGRVVVSINHQMTDFTTGRRKDLEFLLARPDTMQGTTSNGTYAGLVDRLGLVLDDTQAADLAALPELRVAPPGEILVAVQPKACMTAHLRSLTRLYDELDTWHRFLHGGSLQALAIGYVQVNAAEEFLSPVANSGRVGPENAQVSRHKQPSDTVRVVDKIAEIPRRSASSEIGFDAIGVTVLDLRNDGSPVRVVTGAPAPQPGTQFHYGSMIVRMANEYDTVFGQI